MADFIIYGATESIYNVVKREINLIENKIVAFVDSNPFKKEVIFDGGRVISSETLKNYEFDYIFIGAYRSVENIVEYLKSIGIDARKIQLLITEDICNYDVGNIDIFDWRETLKYYNNPSLIREILSKYGNKKQISQIDDIKNDINSDDWFFEKRLISHALGGRIGNMQYMYTNSAEALRTTIENDFSLVECDVIKVNENGWFLGNSYESIAQTAEYSLTLLSLVDFINLFRNCNLTCLIDVKWKKPDEYKEFVEVLENLVKDETNLKARLILEVYDKSSIKIAKQAGYDVFYTLYRTGYNESIESILKTCIQNKVKVIGFSSSFALENRLFITQLAKEGLIIYTYSTDSIDEYSDLRSIGVYGVFTNLLIENKN